MKILIGIDDTDNAESRGTGFRARQLGQLIEANKLGTIESISRHQLFYDQRIPYTSQNSSACLFVKGEDIQNLIDLSKAFLTEFSAEGSDAGLALSFEENITDEIKRWGNRAKCEVLTQNEANEILQRSDIFLEGLTGDKDGIIGSLAAVGLRQQGNDGRCIWLKGKEIRELNGVFSGSELKKLINVDQIIDTFGTEISAEKKIDIGNWLRPVIINNKITIIADKIYNISEYEYKVVSKDYIKSISD